MTGPPRLRNVPTTLARSALRVAASLALAASAWAGYDVTPSVAVPNPDAEVAAEALRIGDWQRAAENFEAALRAEPANAGFHGGLGHAYRKLGKLDLSLRHLREALKLDASSRGAHESIDEAYLAVGDRAKARAHLAALELLCRGRGCDEYRNLERAIAAAR